MQYEWDDAKSERTRRTRGFGFEIIEGFDWDFAECFDVQFEQGEEREKWIGPIGNRLYVLIAVQNETAFRVVSLSLADAGEVRDWRKEASHE